MRYCASVSALAQGLCPALHEPLRVVRPLSLLIEPGHDNRAWEVEMEEKGCATGDSDEAVCQDARARKSLTQSLINTTSSNSYSASENTYER